MSKTKGSGWFSLCVGVAFIITLAISAAHDLRTVDVYRAFQAWLFFAAAILVVWGAIRVKRGEDGWEIGQPTLNFVVGIIGATVALLALIKQR